MILKGLENIGKVYFIGIGGISMSALAKYLSVCGYSVSGSDGVRGEETENLGADGERAELCGADTVVYTDAIPADHVELAKAVELNKRLLSRAELLRIVCENFPRVIAVAGSHGKTTCTSMCAHVLKTAQVPFTAHIGGEDLAFGNFHSTGGEYLVTG